MSEDVPLEIERRFLIIDSFRLPPLGAGKRIIQCYLPKWRIELEGNNIVFEGICLVGGLSRGALKGVRDLLDGGDLTSRIRIKGDCGFFTIKGPVKDGARVEWEFEIPCERIQNLVESWRFPTVVKQRYEIPEAGGLIWEVDFFEGDNSGLVLAEIELPNYEHAYSKPEWIGLEVTEDSRFGSGSLAREPWCDLKEEL